MLELSVGKKLNGLSPFPEEAGLKQQIWFHNGIFRKTIEVFEVKDDESFLKERAKPPFRKAPLKGHLSTLKSSLDPSSCTGLLTFGSPASCFAVARTDPSSNPFSLLP
jgi:hypothetical protein